MQEDNSTNGENAQSIKVFNNPEFGQVRTYVEPDGAVLFCATDVAKALGYARPADAVTAHCRGSVFYRPIVDQLGRTQEAKFITQSDVLRLIVSSKLPNAQKFEAWIFEEVMPSVMNNGGYLTPQKIEEFLLSPDTIIRLATDLKTAREHISGLEAQKALDAKVIDTQTARIDHMRPKALFADAVATSDSTILIGDLAKIIKQSCGVNTGQKRLFEWMRANGWLIKDGSSKNMPTQKAMDMELFRIKETTITNPDGSVRVTKTTKVTGRGQQYFVNVFAGMAAKEVA